MTDHIEDRVLAAAELAQLHLRLGVVRCDHFADSVSPEVVAAMCRVVAAGRSDLLECHACYCDEAWRGRGLHAPECKFDEVDDLRSALAALDAMEAGR